MRVPTLSEPISHYCDAVCYGDMVYVSGCPPLDGEGNLVGGDDPTAQARQVIENLATILAACGSSIGQILKVTVFLTHIEDRQAVDVARREAFGPARPASTLVEVSNLAIPGMRVEIEAIAAVDPAAVPVPTSTQPAKEST
ncbi:MAG: RidA family protein [Solirubrobacterales bacterium]